MGGVEWERMMVGEGSRAGMGLWLRRYCVGCGDFRPAMREGGRMWPLWVPAGEGGALRIMGARRGREWETPPPGGSTGSTGSEDLVEGAMVDIIWGGGPSGVVNLDISGGGSGEG